MKINIIGAGLAGVEAANYLATRGIAVTLYEQKPKRKSPAHHADTFAELVCSNSLKAERVNSAAGLLKAEMRLFGSVCLDAADLCRVPAGGALSVDRDKFTEIITRKILENKNITVVHGEVKTIPEGEYTIIATGPLTDGDMAKCIENLCGGCLSFYDAAAPIITAESIDRDKCFTASRYGRGGEDDYINCPMNKEQYEIFHDALVHAESAEVHEFDRKGDRKVYEGCMPIEIMASRGKDTIRFGPLKPVGLIDPNTGHRPWAVLQLRRENAEGTMYNLVGFQTNLKFAEQKRVFSLIPALHDAAFVRYGVMHRNSFIDSPRLLTDRFELISHPGIYFAGQITGVEGYMESAMSGIIAADDIYRKICGDDKLNLPTTTMCGALTSYISDETVTKFQPMGAAFGLIPPPPTKIKDKTERYTYLSTRALTDLKSALDKEE